MPRARFRKLSEARRAEILAAAAREFADHGFESASFNHVLEEVTLSKGAAYYYFDGKEDLFATVVGGALDEVEGWIGDPESLGAAGDYWADVVELVHRALRRLDADATLVGLLRSLSRVPPGRSRRTDDLHARWTKLLAAVLDVGRRRGAVRQDLPPSLVRHVTAGVVRGLDRWLDESEDAPTDPRRLATLAGDLARRVVGG